MAGVQNELRGTGVGEAVALLLLLSLVDSSSVQVAQVALAGVLEVVRWYKSFVMLLERMESSFAEFDLDVPA